MIASSVQNEFEASVSYKNDEDTGNGTDGSDDGNWTYEDEPLKGTDGSRIAAYHAGKAMWRCDECGKYIYTHIHTRARAHTHTHTHTHNFRIIKNIFAIIL